MSTKTNDAEWSPKQWEKEARRITQHLKNVRKGTRVQNTRSKEVAVATERIDRTHPYVQVLWIQVRGKHKGRKLRTAWAAENVRIVK